jgi:hypothetical protein
MYRIVDGRGTGKTSRLMLLAKDIGATIVCSNPHAMEQKAHAYGITGINFISYGEFTPERRAGDTGKYLIDELEAYLDHHFRYETRIVGYTISEE